METGTYRDLLTYGKASLDNPEEALIILAIAIGCGKAAVYMRLDDRCENATIVKRYLEMLDRRSHSEPIQYIAGSWEFMSLDFLVNRSTLIPRSETEVLAGRLIDMVKRSNEEAPSPKEVKILDLCTGTGCVAVSLAFFLPNAWVTGVDISTDAIELAKKNAAKNGVSDRVGFIECDVFNCDSLDRLFDATGVVDFICSNPPYIPTSDIDGLMPDVRDYEPLVALDGGEDGLNFYRRFADSVLPRFLSDNGFAAFEVGAGQAPLVKHIICRRNAELHTYFAKDIHDIDRVVCFGNNPKVLYQ